MFLKEMLGAFWSLPVGSHSYAGDPALNLHPKDRNYVSVATLECL